VCSRANGSLWGEPKRSPEPGDHLVCDVLGESVIVTRQRDASLSGYVNLCRHRGSRLTDAAGKPAQTGIGPSGSFKGSIQCPYHAWTYSFDGRLRAAPSSTRVTGSPRRTCLCTMWGSTPAHELVV